MAATGWAHLQLAHGDWDAVAVSLGLTALSMLLIVLLGTPLAFWLTRPAAAATGL